MKKFKQTMSGIIALLMILTSLSIMPAVSAEEVATVILDEDCSDAPIGKKADDPATDGHDHTMTYGEWQVISGGTGGSKETNAPVKSADATGMVLQNSANNYGGTQNAPYLIRKLTQDTGAENLKTGAYEISFDVTASANGWLSVNLTDTNVYSNVASDSYVKNMIINLVTGVTGVSIPDGNAYIFQTPADKPLWKGVSGSALSTWWLTGIADETKELNVKTVVNMDTGKMSVYTYQDGEMVTSTTNVALSDNIKTNGLGYIVFGNTEGDTKISNLKVTQLIDAGERFYGYVEKFDNADVMSSRTITAPGALHGLEIREKPEGASMYIDKDTYTPDNVLRIEKSQPLRINLRTVSGNYEGGDALKGRYVLKAKMLAGSGEVMFEFGYNLVQAKKVQLRLDKQEAVVRHHDVEASGDNNTAYYENKGTSAGSFDPSKWCDIEINLDIPNGIYGYTISQDGVPVVEQSDIALNNTIKTNGFNFLQLYGVQSADADSVKHDPLMYVDDISVEEYASEPEEELNPAAFEKVTENFETAGMLTNGTFSSDAAAKGWTASAAAGFNKEIASKDGSNVLKISGAQMENVRLSLATNGGTALKGKYTITYRMFDEAGEVFGEIGHASFSANVLQVRLDQAEGKVRHNLGDTASGANAHPLYENKGTDSGTFNPAKWCDVKVIVDVPENKWSYTVKQDGAIVASATDVELTPNVATHGFNFFQVRGLNGGSPNPIYYLDDLEIREYVEGDEESGEVVPPVVEEEFKNLNETFDNWTTVPGNSSWESPSAAYKLPGLDTVEGTNKALYISPNSEGYERGIRYKFGKAVTDGTLNISYDIKVKKALASDGTTLSHIIWPSLDAKADGTDWGSAYPYINNNKVRINYNLDEDRGDVNSLVSTDITEDEWYTVTMAIKPAESKYDIKMVNKATGVKFCEYTNKPFENRLGEAQTQVEAFTFRTWVGDTWIDNMVIEHIKQKPELSNSSIKMFDSFGNQTQSITTNVTRALGTIELDFATAMKDISGITLTGKDAPAISAVIDEENAKKATITLDGMLTAKETYVLTVPGTVTAVNDETMGTDFVLEFGVGEAQTTADMSGITVEGAAVTTYAELAAKAGKTATIGTSAVNTADSAMTLTYIVAYYNGNKCLKVKTVATPEVGANNVLKEQPTFTIENVQDATRVKVFLWTSLNELIPYCGALELK